MVTSQFSEGITEVLDILAHMDEEYIAKIPDDFMKFLKENRSPTYISKLDHTKNLQDMELKDETRKILGVIYMNYWSDEKEKTEFKQQLLANERAYQKELKKIYSPNQIFDNNGVNNTFNIGIDNSNSEEKFPTELPEKKNFITKIIDFFNSIFKK